jgi:hypothetical protein
MDFTCFSQRAVISLFDIKQFVFVMYARATSFLCGRNLSFKVMDAQYVFYEV